MTDERAFQERGWAFASARAMRQQAAMQQRAAQRVARVRGVRPAIEEPPFVWTVPDAPQAYPDVGGLLVVALALGGARNVFDEAAAAYALLGREFDMVVACNDVGADWKGKLTHWATLHPDKFREWELRRHKNGHPMAYEVHFHRHYVRTTPYKITHDWTGSSGLLAVKVALEAGAQRVVCAGIPMTPSAHYHDHPNKAWRYAAHHQRGWSVHMHELRGRVRSMSGWTAQQLGMPDREWLGATDGQDIRAD